MKQASSELVINRPALLGEGGNNEPPQVVLGFAGAPVVLLHLHLLLPCADRDNIVILYIIVIPLLCSWLGAGNGGAAIIAKEVTIVQ
jgi:hypothetical protein